MVGWKERGYVPDSDDEDEDVGVVIGSNANPEHQIDSLVNTQIGDSASPSQPNFNSSTSANNETTSSIPKQGDTFLALQDAGGENHSVQRSSFINPASTVADRLEAELNKGIQLTQEVLGSFIDRDDDTDSPLSSPPDSLPNSPRQHAPSLRTSSLPSATGGKLDIQATIQSLTSTTPPGRSFRRRAPIQLHPYALEDAKYRQSLKDRGLKPVRTLGATPGQQTGDKAESQSVDGQPSSQMDDSYHQSPRSSPMMQDPDDESQSPVRAIRRPATDIDLGEELPELNDILNSNVIQPPNAARGTHRRLQRPRKAPRKPIHDEYHVFDLPNENEPAALLRRSRHVFRVPPSPPRSRDDLSSQDAVNLDDDQQSQADPAPFSLPTPLLSSETRPKRPLSRSASPFSHISGSLDISDESSDSALSEHSDDESQGVHRLQRKIKGVLPASWLKLDQKEQRGVEKQTQKPLHSPMRSAIERGVAKHVSGSRTRIDLADLSLYSESESESESDNNNPAGLPYGNDVGDDLDSFMDDVTEDNTVDAMLPPRSRDNSRRKKQQRLREVWANTRNRSSIRAVASHSGNSGASNARPKASGGSRPRKRLKKSHSKPQMTVLDAPGFDEPKIPRFLRIAARRNKSSNRQLGQDQSKKFFRLATKQDTLDVRAGLLQWKSHRAQRNSTLPSSNVAHSRPLSPQPRPQPDLSATRHNRNDNTTHLTLLKQSTKATLKRVQFNQTQRNALSSQSRLHPQPYAQSLAEFFKPRPVSSNHSSWQQPFDLFNRSHNQGAIPPKQKSLPRRVPKNTSNIRDSSKQQDIQSIADSSSATIPPNSSRKHRSR